MACLLAVLYNGLFACSALEWLVCLQCFIMACLLAVLYNGLFAYSGSWGPFGGWCNARNLTPCSSCHALFAYKGLICSHYFTSFIIAPK